MFAFVKALLSGPAAGGRSCLADSADSLHSSLLDSASQGAFAPIWLDSCVRRGGSPNWRLAGAIGTRLSVEPNLFVLSEAKTLNVLSPRFAPKAPDRAFPSVRPQVQATFRVLSPGLEESS